MKSYQNRLRKKGYLLTSDDLDMSKDEALIKLIYRCIHHVIEELESEYSIGITISRAERGKLLKIASEAFFSIDWGGDFQVSAMYSAVRNAIKKMKGLPNGKEKEEKA